MIDTAFITPALRAKLHAPKSEPVHPRKTAQQRRLETIERHLTKEAAAREKAFQKRVDEIAAAIYQPFQPRERCILDTTPILTDGQRRKYAIEAQLNSAGTASRRKIRRELKDMRRRKQAGGQ